MLFDEYVQAVGQPAGDTPDRSAAGRQPPVEEPISRTAHALPPAPARSTVTPRRIVGARGVTVAGPFLAFYEHFGPTLCGEPLTGEVLVDGARAQVFENLVLREDAQGRARPMPIGDEWLRGRAVDGVAGWDSRALGSGGALDVIDLTAALERAADPAAEYPRRALADIRYIVIHHSGADAGIGPDAIAREHVRAFGWPGIGYHFVVGPDGTVWQTQDMTVVSHHARQFNQVAVGIGLAGNFAHTVPPEAQLYGAGRLAGRLLDELGLPSRALRGHRELVETACPGETFLPLWKQRLAGIARRWAVEREPAGLLAAK